MATTIPSRDARRPVRVDGYLPLRDYAVIGNKRTAALVGLDGAIDWLPLPSFSGRAAFCAVLDEGRGGRMRLAPVAPFEATRRYLPDTNVLETTFTTAGGRVRVTDALSRPIAEPLLWNQVIRRVDGLAGTVPMAWSVEPRFDDGATAGCATRRGGVPVFAHGRHALAVEAFDVGEAGQGPDDVRGTFDATEGAVGVLAVSDFYAMPLTFSTRDALLSRLDATADRWRRRAQSCAYDGPWRDAVLRSALALDLLVDDETGAIAAAATMGLPERIGGPRNFDYRYAWLRDANLALEAMQRLGFADQVHRSLGWMLDTVRRTRPWLRPMYRLDGDPRLPDEQLDLAGYRGSRPVVRGNSAQDQVQLGSYGDLFDMSFKYVEAGNSLSEADGVELATIADYLCRIWEHRDASLWELGDLRDYTQSKLAAWMALDRAVRLADRGQLPAGSRVRWHEEARRARTFLESRCWSERMRSYGRSADGDELDAGVLLATRGSFLEHETDRFNATIDAIRRELGAGGPLVYRYTGMADEEGAFVACSFWVAEALARAGRLDEASEAMDALVALTNDVGLLSEEIDPPTGDFLGNLPQALSHLALVNAAGAFVEAQAERSAR